MKWAYFDGKDDEGVELWQIDLPNTLHLCVMLDVDDGSKLSHSGEAKFSFEAELKEMSVTDAKLATLRAMYDELGNMQSKLLDAMEALGN